MATTVYSWAGSTQNVAVVLFLTTLKNIFKDFHTMWIAYQDGCLLHTFVPDWVLTASSWPSSVHEILSRCPTKNEFHQEYLSSSLWTLFTLRIAVHCALYDTAFIASYDIFVQSRFLRFCSIYSHLQSL